VQSHSGTAAAAAPSSCATTNKKGVDEMPNSKTTRHHKNENAGRDVFIICVKRKVWIGTVWRGGIVLIY
jgi:hypothetical protein